MNDKPLSCTVKPAVSLAADGKSFHSGVKVIDISFPSVVNPEATSEEENVGEIRFQNFYVAFLTIKAKLKVSPEESAREKSGGWRLVLRRFKLMPSPHAETGAQDYFSLTRRHFNLDLHQVVSVRFILQQPSPVWNDFKLEDIKLFRNQPGAKAPPLPSWVLEDEKPNKTGKKEIQEGQDVCVETQKDMGVPDLEVLSSSLQQLWALAEEVAANQTEESLGRYEVDGCYDINLLAYS